MQIENDLFVLPYDELCRQQGMYVDLKLPKKIIRFCEEFCTLTDDCYNGPAGRKVTLLPFQKALINTMYGWRKKDGRFRTRYCHVYCPKRCGKSVLMSCLSAFHSLADQRADVILTASCVPQAMNLFKRIRDFIESSEDLAKDFWPREHLKQIVNKKTASTIHILSSNPEGKSSYSPTLIGFDEFAEIPRTAAQTVWDRLTRSGLDRSMKFILTITTPQFDLSHLAFEKYKLCKSILEGKCDDTAVLPVVYEAPENWRDNVEAALDQCFPALNMTVDKRDLLDDWQSAQGKPGEEYNFETLMMGRWVGSSETWLNQTYWQSCCGMVNESDFYGSVVDIGLDYASKFDICCYTITTERNGIYQSFPRYFIPRGENNCIAVERGETDNINYLSLSAHPQYKMTLTDGNVVDSSALIQSLKRDAAHFNIRSIRFDPTRTEGFRQLIEQQPEFRGKLIEVPQTVYHMSPAFSMIERIVSAGQFKTPDNPITNYCVSNCKPVRDKHDRLDVVKSGHYNKIDFVDALACSLTAWLEHKVDPKALPPGNVWGETVG